ncbi:MAG: penicillin-binding protein activator [Chitinispirillaceae bacterium]|nr:penicillin-binding protein activator [Chitinispirillaceae bacterium]
MYRYLYVIAILIFFISPSGAFSSAVYDRAVKAYSEGKYDTTIVLIKAHLRKNSKDPQSEQLVPLVTEALLRKGDTESTHRLISMFKQKYPSSRFTARMWYLDGVAFAREEKFLKALNAFSAALDAGVSRTLDSLVMVNSEVIANVMCADEFAAIPSKFLHGRIAEMMRFYEITKLYQIGEYSKAQGLADQFQKVYPRSRYNQKVGSFFSRAKVKEKDLSTINIGVLAPISGDEGEIGRRIVSGIQLAIDQYNSRKSLKVKPLILDTKGSMVETALKTQELVSQRSVPVIIGPMLSQTATVCAAISMDKPVVMISPTATDDGISELGKNIFQMNTTMGVLARKIASYAIDNLNIREFAIMAPQTPYGRLMADNFKKELQKRNIEVVAEEYFEEGGNDFKPQFTSLRSKLLDHYINKQMVERSIDYKGRALVRADSTRYADSTLPVQGLFIPAEADDIVMLAPQVFFHRIRTQMLGSNGWQNQKVIDDGQRYVLNTMFSASFEPNQTQSNWMEFKKAFRARYNGEPDKISALGYDAASLVLRAIETAGDNPERIAEALSEVTGYSGLSSTISFSPENRTNTEAVIMKVTQKGFVRVQ